MKKLLVKYLGMGLLMLVVWNLVLLAISLVFGSEGTENQAPTLLPMIIFAAVMAIIVAAAIRLVKPQSDREAYGFSITWSLIVLVANVGVAVGNQTVGVFFGHWYSWLVFLTMAGAPVLLKLLPSKEVAADAR